MRCDSLWSVSDAVLPLCRITGRVQNSENDDELAFDRKVNCVRKLFSESTANPGTKFLICLRTAKHTFVTVAKLVQKLETKIRLLGLVPLKRALNVELDGRVGLQLV